MIIDTRPQYDFDDVMFLPQVTDPSKGVSSRSDVNLVRTFKPGNNRSFKWSGIPIIAANMDTIGTFAMAEELIKYDCCTALHKHYEVNDLIEFYNAHEDKQHLLFYTMGIGGLEEMGKLHRFSEGVGELVGHKFYEPLNICIDVANGYLDKLRETVAKVRDKYPNAIIMAGNVVTSDAVHALIQAGASIVKVGIGSGSACTTRRLTGVGRPQLSAIIDCANAAHAMNALICADGGCVHPSHVSKAIGAGADFVMLGGMFAGHDECGGKISYTSSVTEWNHEVESVGEVRNPKDRPTMEFYGMSSETAMDKHNGGLASYRASEGRTLKVPYKGRVSTTIEHILGGIRSTMTYIGAKELKEISKCATFIPVKNQLNTSLAKYES